MFNKVYIMNRLSAVKVLTIVFLVNFLMACSLFPADTPTHISSSINPLVGIGKVKPVASGFISTEGPVWHKTSNSLIFSDIPGNTIYSLETSNNRLTILRKPTNTANGLAIDDKGYLLAAEQQTRIISRMNLVNKEVEPYISQVKIDGVEKAFNSPNDMAIFQDGSVFFTDPPFGLRGRKSELNFNGVFVQRANGNVEVIKKLNINEKPNGIIFNPEQSILYIAISDDVSAPILAYDVDGTGSLSNERVFAHAQNADGMAIDKLGNLYVATRTGIDVFSPTGKRWGKILLPESKRTTNCAFGGKNMNTLYITSRSSQLYAVELNVQGHL